MNEPVERVIPGIGDEPPSAAFRDRLRAEMVAADALHEAAPTGAGGDEAWIQPVDVATFTQRARRRSGMLVTAAAVVALLAVGVWLVSSSADGNRVDTAVPVTTAAPASDPPLVTAGNLFVEAGAYRIETLGTAFDFRVTDTTGIVRNGDGLVAITAFTSTNADDRTITLRRAAALPDPASPTAALPVTGGWPADDLSGWLERVDGLDQVSDVSEATLGGLDATVVTLEVPCETPRCVAPDPLAERDLPLFNAGSSYQLFVVDQGGADPIILTIATDGADDAPWLTEAQGIVSTISFGQIEPNPTRRVTGGASTLEALGGTITFDVAGETLVSTYPGLTRLVPNGINGDVELLTRPLDTNGTPVTTVGRLTELLDDAAIVRGNDDVAEIDGIAGRSFQVESAASALPVLKTREAEVYRSELGWGSPALGQLWVFEHPTNGLLIVSAESFEGPAALDELRSWAELLLASIGFEEA